VQSSTSNETLINSGIFCNDFEYYENNNFIKYHRNSKYLSANLFQEKKSIQINQEQKAVTKRPNFSCDKAAEKEQQSDLLGDYAAARGESDCIVFGISKNKADCSSIINNSNYNYHSENSNNKGKDFNCSGDINESENNTNIHKEDKDKESLNLCGINEENKESSASKISKISKIIHENLYENSLINYNNNYNNVNRENLNYGMRKNFNQNLIQLGNLKINDVNDNIISTTKNHMSNIKNSCNFSLSVFNKYYKNY